MLAEQMARKSGKESAMLRHAVLSADRNGWRSLTCPRRELRLDLTLPCGQSFRWRETADGHWTGVMAGRVWTLTQSEDTLWYYVYPRDPQEAKVEKESEEESMTTRGVAVKGVEPTGVSEEEELLRDYFQLSVSLQDLHQHWSSADEHFSRTAHAFTGVRLLRQEPVECLFSFICSSNNNISRIQKMVSALCDALGPLLGRIDDLRYHDFPSLQALSDGGVEQRLRDLGFGYRARFLQQSAGIIVTSRDPGWLESLRAAPYLQARDALTALPGVGLKVADCVCLMSLDKREAVPVDTHVWQIVQRYYGFAAGGRKSLTHTLYTHIGDFLRGRWGPSAGWAQSVLFCAELKRNQPPAAQRKRRREPSSEPARS